MLDLVATLRERDAVFRLRHNLVAIPEELSDEEYLKEVVIKIVGIFDEITEGSKCPRCSQMSVIRQERQDRSGDEGANLIHRCTKPGCGYQRRE